MAAVVAAAGPALAAGPGEIPKPPGANPGDRGWEKVSPADKGGLDVAGVSYWTWAQAADGGDALLFGSMGTFAGAPSGGFPNHYLARRTAGAWSSSPATPPSVATVLPPTGSAGPGHTAGILSLDAELQHAVVESSAQVVPGANPGVFGLFGKDLRGESPYRTISPPGATYAEALYERYFLGRWPEPFFRAATSTGSHTLFTTSWQMTPDAPADGLKLYEASDDGVRIAAELPGGAPIPSHTEAIPGSLAGTHHAISEDGKRLYFSVPSNPNSSDYQLYLRDGDATVAIDTGTTNVFYAATPDGGKAIYTSGASLYMYDAESQQSTLLSVDEVPDAPAAAGDLTVLAASEDLDYVYFAAGDMLLAGQDPVAGGGAVGFDRAIYLWHDGEVSYVAPLRDDLDDGVGPGYFPPSAYPNTNGWVNRWFVSWTPDGRSVVFDTTANVTGYSSQGTRQVYRYDADDDEMACLSCPDGPPVANATLGGEAIDRLGSNARPFAQRPLNYVSDDGDRVFFNSREALVAGDVNNRYDVYLWERGELSLVSDGVSPFHSRFVDASANGDDAYFATAAPLVAADTDGLVDVYDARVGGGFPEPGHASPACAAAACQGESAGGPEARSRGSASMRSGGDVSAAPRTAVAVRGLTAIQRSSLAAGRRTRVRLTVSRPGRVTVSVRVRGRSRVVARGSARARRAGAVSVPIRLSRSARGELLRRGRLRLTLSARLGSARSEPMALRLTKSGGR